MIYGDALNQLNGWMVHAFDPFLILTPILCIYLNVYCLAYLPSLVSLQSFDFTHIIFSLLSWSIHHWILFIEISLFFHHGCWAVIGPWLSSMRNLWFFLLIFFDHLWNRYIEYFSLGFRRIPTVTIILVRAFIQRIPFSIPLPHILFIRGTR